ncbi:hypothetical protein G6F43_012051 [Rhizopus delemar]|nr:hypothetical protein G6F43_012051 [Rhizopus delemar]
MQRVIEVTKGELRLGVEVEQFHGITWRHWACCTPQVIRNMHTALSGPEELNGWDELREDDQERIRRTWEEGKIPDNEKPDPAHPKETKVDNVTDEEEDNDMNDKGTEGEESYEEANGEEEHGKDEHGEDEDDEYEGHHQGSSSPPPAGRKRKIVDLPISEEEKNERLRKIRREAGRKGGKIGGRKGGKIGGAASKSTKKPGAGRRIGKKDTASKSGESRKRSMEEEGDEDVEDRYVLKLCGAIYTNTYFYDELASRQRLKELSDIKKSKAINT